MDTVLGFGLLSFVFSLDLLLILGHNQGINIHPLKESLIHKAINLLGKTKISLGTSYNVDSGQHQHVYKLGSSSIEIKADKTRK